MMTLVAWIHTDLLILYNTVLMRWYGFYSFPQKVSSFSVFLFQYRLCSSIGEGIMFCLNQISLPQSSSQMKAPSCTLVCVVNKTCPSNKAHHLLCYILCYEILHLVQDLRLSSWTGTWSWSFTWCRIPALRCAARAATFPTWACCALGKVRVCHTPLLLVHKSSRVTSFF